MVEFRWWKDWSKREKEKELDLVFHLVHMGLEHISGEMIHQSDRKRSEFPVEDEDFQKRSELCCSKNPQKDLNSSI